MLPRPSELKNIVQDWSREDYFSDDALNFHALYHGFRKNPKRYSEGYYEKESDDPKRRDAMRQGTQLHELVLEGSETFEANNVLWTPPVNEKTGKPYGQGTKNYTEALDALLAENPGKEIYTAEELDTYRAMYNAVLNHPKAKKYLFPEDQDRAASELKFRGEIAPGWFVKGAIDRYDSVFGIIDLKTTAEIESDSGYGSFEKTCLNYGYIEQLAFYQVMFHELLDPTGGEYPTVTIIGIEKKEPYTVVMRQPDEETIRGAREYIMNLYDFYVFCAANQYWPDPYEEIVPIHKSYNYYNRDRIFTLDPRNTITH